MRIGIENNNDDRSIAWALEHPGCFAYGADAAEAEANMRQAARDYTDWVAQHGATWLEPRPLEVRVEETYDVYRILPDGTPAQGSDGYMVESFFQYDTQPLTGTEIEHALQLLEWSRADLLNVVRGLTPEKLRQAYPGERWSIHGILQHIAGGEWFYQERIGAPFPALEEQLPGDPLESLELVRAHFLALLPSLEGVRQVLVVEGETWSPRKVLRRAAWHERDHTQHIRKLLPQTGLPG